MGLAVRPLQGDSEDWDQYLEEPVCAPLLVSEPTVGSLNDHQETLRNSDVLGATEFLPCPPKHSVGRREQPGSGNGWGQLPEVQKGSGHVQAQGGPPHTPEIPPWALDSRPRR